MKVFMKEVLEYARLILVLSTASFIVVAPLYIYAEII
jgi:hypothetical protein